MASGADEAGIEGAREGDVGGALDEGAAVGKDGEGVGRALKAQQQATVSPLTMCGVLQLG